MEEIFKVFAVKELDFTAQDGNTISGRNIFMGQETHERGWQGMSCEKFFVRKDSDCYKGYCPKAGEEVIVEFNRYGKIQSIRPVA